MIVRKVSLLALFFTLAIGAGCVSKTDMETLQVERQRDLNRIQQLEQELEESKTLLKDEIEKSQSPVRQRTANMWADLESLKTDFAKLRGELETLNLRLDRQVGESNSTISMATLDNRIQEIEFALENQLHVDLPKARQDREKSMTVAIAPLIAADNATETAETSEQPQAQPEPAVQPAEDTDPAKALYDKAYALYKNGKYEQARSYWAEFTDTFKEHPFSASAVFWQGQSYYKMKDYARAVILYEDVIEKFKKSSKYKSALLRSGYCWNHLGKPELAKMRMNEVVKKFPKSVESTQAKRFLEKTKQ